MATRLRDGAEKKKTPKHEVNMFCFSNDLRSAIMLDGYRVQFVGKDGRRLRVVFQLPTPVAFMIYPYKR